MAEKHRTIVDGRSKSDRLVGDFSRSIEILLKKASVDSVFKQFLLIDPLKAAQSIALDLKPMEINILTNTSLPVLERMISNIHVPKQHIKTFRTGKTTAILALVLSTTVIMPAMASAGIEELPSQGIELENLARERMMVIQEALEAYRIDHGTYPETRIWYETPGPLAEYSTLNEIYDPWKRKFHYKAVKKDGVIVNYKLESFGLDSETFNDNIPCPIATYEHRFTGVSPINILYPLEENTIFTNELPDGILEIRAEHENEMVYVNWYLNGIFIGNTVKVHTLTTEPDTGGNTLLLVDENEESTSIHFLVSERRVSQ
jgi:membrane carboxypeptidase/penicillin-binding protein PbpC